MGKCIQVLHVGPYSEETKSIAKIKRYAEKRGFKLISPHYEIYISDSRKTSPEKLKTIIRYRVESHNVAF